MDRVVPPYGVTTVEQILCIGRVSSRDPAGLSRIRRDSGRRESPLGTKLSPARTLEILRSRTLQPSNKFCTSGGSRLKIRRDFLEFGGTLVIGTKIEFRSKGTAVAYVTIPVANLLRNKERQSWHGLHGWFCRWLSNNHASCSRVT
jgi:hypothetical protein